MRLGFIGEEWITVRLQVPKVMVGVDAHGLTVFWNRGAQALFGWSSEEVLGKVPPMVPPTLCQEWQLQMQRVLETGQPSQAAWP